MYCHRHCTREGRRTAVPPSHFLARRRAAWRCFCCAYIITVGIYTWSNFGVILHIYAITGYAQLYARNKIVCSCTHDFCLFWAPVELLILGTPTLSIITSDTLGIFTYICYTYILHLFNKIYPRRVWSGIPWQVGWW